MFKFSADVEFKTILLIYKVLNNQTPSQHKECIVAYNTDRVICSQSAGLVLAPRISKVEAVAGPSAIRLKCVCAMHILKVALWSQLLVCPQEHTLSFTPTIECLPFPVVCVLS